MGKSVDTLDLYGGSSRTTMENNNNKRVVVTTTTTRMGGLLSSTAASGRASKRSSTSTSTSMETTSTSSSSPMDALTPGARVLSGRSTTASSSSKQCPPLGRVTINNDVLLMNNSNNNNSNNNSSNNVNNKLCNTIQSSPRRSLRSNSTAVVVTDEEQQISNQSFVSTITTSSESNNNSNDKKDIFVLNKGDRCAIYFAKGKDIFGTNRTGAGGWHPATITKVTRHWQQTQTSTQTSNKSSTHKLHVRFDDGSTSSCEYPSDEVQILTTKAPASSSHHGSSSSSTSPNNNNNNSNIMYGLESGRMLYQQRPSKLQAGDLVYAFFQQGQGLTSEDWFRGRVLCTHRLEDLPVCDIAYDDGDVETNVPYTAGVVFKLQDGWDFPAWMLGLEVNIPPKKKQFHATTGQQITSGTVVEAKPHGAVWIEYSKGGDDGGIFREKRAYLMVAQRLLQHAKNNLMDPKRVFSWPYLSDKAAEQEAAHMANNNNNNNKVLSSNAALANIMQESKSGSKPSPPKKATKQRVARAKNKQQQQQVINLVDEESENKKKKAKQQQRPQDVIDVDMEEASQQGQQVPPKKKLRADKTPKSTTKAAPPPAVLKSTPLPVNVAKPAAAARARAATEAAATESKPPTGRKRATTTTTKKSASSTVQKRAAASRARAADSPTIDGQGGGVQLETEYGASNSSDVVCVAESDSEDVVVLATSSQPSSTRRPMKDIDLSLASTFERCLNSSDPHLGAEVLTFLAVHHKQMPGSRLRKALVTLLTHGPKSGSTMFDDCHRLQLAEQYVTHCLTRPDMAQQFALDAGPTYWSDCLTNLTALYYCAEGDEDRTSSYAIDRIAQSVFAKTCCADLFLHLLESQLQPLIGKTKKSEIKREDVLTLPIVKDIVCHRRGAKEALESSAKAYVELSSTLGHFDQGHIAGLLSNQQQEDDDDSPSEKSIQFLCLHARRLLQQAGHITSLLAWLYGYVANEDVKSVGRLLRSIFQRALDDEKQFDPSQFLKDGGAAGGGGVTLDKHWMLVKLRLVLNLDKRPIPQVRPMLAETLGVGQQYNALFG